jgi:ribose-phosphate pyrophosphokinase
MFNEIKIFSGNANLDLAKEICRYAGVNLGLSKRIMFANENIKIVIGESVREFDVFVIQPACSPVNEGLVELLIFIDALKHASAARITAVIPYFFYCRSDKKDEPRISITARLVADLLQTAGADRVLTMNLHSPQIQGFFHIPVDHLSAGSLVCDHFRRMDLSNHVVVATDAGGARRAARYAKNLQLPFAILDKRRSDDSEKAEILNVIGEVKGKKALIFDDEVSTAGSLSEAVKILHDLGVTDIRAAMIHGILAGPAMERVQKMNLKELVLTNSLTIPKEKRLKNMTILSVAPMLADAIRRIHHGESISEIFVDR